MSEEATSTAEIDRLERLVGGDPGAPGFAALAEAHRRAGRAREAEAVARAGLERCPDALHGRVALGLALLDRGRVAEARAELERVLAETAEPPRARAALEQASARSDGAASAPSEAADAELPEGIGDPEIEDAFNHAVFEPSGSLTPDRVAEAAVEDVAWGAEEDEDEAGAADDTGGDDGSGEEIPVATATVADLLERQGSSGRARAMRASLARGEQERIIATLERWLDNLRRGHA